MENLGRCIPTSPESRMTSYSRLNKINPSEYHKLTKKAAQSSWTKMITIKRSQKGKYTWTVEQWILALRIQRKINTSWQPTTYLYGIPKIYQERVPLGSITSCQNSSTSELRKFFLPTVLNRWREKHLSTSRTCSIL